MQGELPNGNGPHLELHAVLPWKGISTNKGTRFLTKDSFWSNLGQMLLHLNPRWAGGSGNKKRQEEQVGPHRTDRGLRPAVLIVSINLWESPQNVAWRRWTQVSTYRMSAKRFPSENACPNELTTCELAATWTGFLIPWWEISLQTNCSQSLAPELVNCVCISIMNREDYESVRFQRVGVVHARAASLHLELSSLSVAWRAPNFKVSRGLATSLTH